MSKYESPILQPRVARLPDGRQVVRVTREIAFIVPAGMAPLAALGDFVLALVEAAACESAEPERPSRPRRHGGREAHRLHA